MTPRGRHALVFAAFVAAALLVRCAAFFQSGMGDESLYLLVAREWLAGKIPYVDIVDNKPPGIYVLFALAQLVFGRSVVAIRLLACLAAASSALLLWRIGDARRRAGELDVGLLAALLYLVHSTGNTGIASNTEVFYTPFVLGGFWLLLGGGRRLERASVPSFGQSLGVGLCFGVALQIKYVVVFDGAAAGVILLHQIWRVGRDQGRLPLGRAARSLGAVAAGGLLPLLLVVVYFASVGHLAEYLGRNIGSNMVNRSDTHFALGHFVVVVKDQIMAYPLLWLPLPAAAYLGATGKLAPRQRRLVEYSFVWLGFAFLGVSFTKLFFRHYFLQLLPAQCLVAALLVGEVLGELPEPRRAIALLLVVLAPLGGVVYPPLVGAAKLTVARVRTHQPHAGDTAAQIGDYLRPRVSAEQSIYVADYKSIIYYLVPSRLPTPYVFPEFLNTEHFARVAAVDPLRELDAILARRPVYIVRRRELATPFYQRLDEAIRRDYTLERAFEEAATSDWMLSEYAEQDHYIELYRRNAAP